MTFEFLSNISKLALNVSLQYLILEGSLGIIFLWLLFSWKKKKSPSLSYEEEEEIIRNWNPEPLVDSSELPINRDPKNYPIINGKVGAITKVSGKDCVNFASNNYYGFAQNTDIEKRVIDCLYKYGVGTCGPRGFYGTIDIHLKLETKLAEFMDMEEAVMYSYGFSTVSSAIAAYAKKPDIIFADEKVNFRIQKGLDASRSTVIYFKHNDMDDLKKKLEEQKVKDSKNPSKAKKIRRFIVIEGIYQYTGTICNLPEIVALCNEHKVRIFIDESISLFTLGEHGKGVTEFFNISRDEVDLIMGSLEYALSSIGGFAIGTSYVVEQQRLSGLGYCFSASLAPLLTEASIAGIEILEHDSSMKYELTDKCRHFQNLLESTLDQYFAVSGHSDSPIKHLHLAKARSIDDEKSLLESIRKFCYDRNFLVAVPTYLDKEVFLPRPSIQLSVNVQQTFQQMDQLVALIKEACIQYL